MRWLGCEVVLSVLPMVEDPARPRLPPLGVADAVAIIVR
jgi:hypothetical protein